MLLSGRGLLAPLFRAITRSWHMYPLGFLAAKNQVLGAFGNAVIHMSDNARSDLAAAYGSERLPCEIGLPLRKPAGLRVRSHVMQSCGVMGRYRTKGTNWPGGTHVSPWS